MEFNCESSDDLYAPNLGSQLSRVESPFCCLRLLETRVFNVDWALGGAVATAPRCLGVSKGATGDTQLTYSYILDVSVCEHGSIYRIRLTEFIHREVIEHETC